MGRRRKTDAPLPDYAEAIRAGRIAAGYRSQGQLASELKCSQQAVADWETGRTRPPFSMATRLADMLRIPLPALLEPSVRAVFEEQQGIATVAEADRAFGTLAQRVHDTMTSAGASPSVALAAQLARAIWRMAGGEDAVLPPATALEAHIENMRGLWHDVVMAARAPK